MAQRCSNHWNQKAPPHCWFWHVLAGGFKPDVVAYGTSISACERCGEWLHALGTLVSAGGIGSAGVSGLSGDHPWRALVRHLASAPDRQAEG